MRLWRLATRNWRASRARTFAMLVSVALGVGTVTVITSFYETARRGIEGEVVARWIGSAHITVSPLGAHWGMMDARLVEPIARMENVKHVAARLSRRVVCFPTAKSEELFGNSAWAVDAIGIDPAAEVHFRAFPNLDGRLPAPNERGVVVLEKEVADDWNVKLGDRVFLATHRGAPQTTLEIIGIFNSQRLAEFQEPMLFVAKKDVEDLKNEPGAATAIDVALHDPSPAAITTAQAAIEKLLKERGESARVDSARARQELLLEAERITRLILSLVAFVALLTAFFIIITTMSMSLFERRTSLGVMRCIGTTRAQLALLLLFEIVPLGVFGTILGFIGAYLFLQLAPHVIPDKDIPYVLLSAWGAKLAVTAGLGTSVVSWAFLVFQINRVSPLAAVYTHARPARTSLAVLTGIVGLLLLALHSAMSGTDDQERWLSPAFAGVGATSLYLGYVLVAPLIVVLTAVPIARLVAPLLALPGKLVTDQISRSPWRSTGICWMLMVGLSLIVYIAVRAESILAIWDFPAKLPEAFIWTHDYVTSDAIERAKRLPGVGPSTITTDVDCEIVTAPTGGLFSAGSFVDSMLRKMTRPVFVAGDPDSLLTLLKITFVEGTLEEAKAKLTRGGAVLLPVQAARNRSLHLGDKITVRVQGKSADFEIAGVVQSPAMDIAVTAFQATSYMDFASASAILGTRADLQTKFGLDIISMFMFNFDMPQAPVPRSFEADKPPDVTSDRVIAGVVVDAADSLESEREVLDRLVPALAEWLDQPNETPLPEELRTEMLVFGKTLRYVAYQWVERTPAENWAEFRQRLVIYRVAAAIERPDAITGSLVRLRRMLSENLNHAVTILTWLPTISLMISAIGVANLMMVSVRMRARQIAILRAVGALKSQIIRLILAEAVTLAVTGSLLGIALGIHQAISINRIVERLLHLRLEFILPLGTIALGTLVTVGICLLAGLGPARHAARNNVVAAMQSA